MKLTILTLCLCCTLLIPNNLNAQLTNAELLGQVNTLAPQVPLLLLSPSAGMGALANIQSVAVNAEQAGLFANPALLAAGGAKLAGSLSYMPWLREVMPSLGLYSIGASVQIRPKHFLGFNALYFDLGQINYIGSPPSHPYEFVPAVTYSYAVGTDLYLGARLKYIHSDLVGNRMVGGVKSNPGRAFALDIGITKNFHSHTGWLDQQIAATVQHVGSKIAYTKNSDKDFIPINLRIGYLASVALTEDLGLSLMYELEKLLIPTPPVYHNDSLDQNGDQVIQYGYDPQVSVTRGMIQSFYDAPAGLEEELAEIRHHLGMDLSYKNFHLLAGYFHEHRTKGNRKYFSVGAAYTRGLLGFSASYLIPDHQNSYLMNTFQISLSFQPVLQN